MRLFLRLAALLLVAAALGWWAQAGRNPGWTKNQVFVDRVDEITGITYQETEERFVPGVDFLAGAGAAGLVLAGLSLLGRRKVRGSR